jgi:hypothetical protein
MNMLTHLLASLINSVEVICKASMCVSMQGVQQVSVHSTWLPATPGMHLLLCLSLTWIIGDFRDPSIAVATPASFVDTQSHIRDIREVGGGGRKEGVRLDFEAISRRLP